MPGLMDECAFQGGFSLPMQALDFHPEKLLSWAEGPESGKSRSLHKHVIIRDFFRLALCYDVALQRLVVFNNSL